MADAARGALDGVTILDLTRVWAGPLATRMLGDLRRERHQGGGHLGAWPEARFGGGCGGLGPLPEQRGRRKAMEPRGDVQQAQPQQAVGHVAARYAGREGQLFERLVSLADVVIENYTPRVMPQLGLGYERLREANPCDRLCVHAGIWLERAIARLRGSRDGART